MRYFFHVRDALGLIRDEEGSELSGIEAARAEARHSARDFALDDLRRGIAVATRQIEITDAAGAVLETMAVRNIVN